MSFRAEALTRHFPFAPDPKAVFSALRGAVLFETGDASTSTRADDPSARPARRSILVTDVAVRLELRGARVRATATSVHGSAVVRSIAEALAGTGNAPASDSLYQQSKAIATAMHRDKVFGFDRQPTMPQLPPAADTAAKVPVAPPASKK